MFRPRDIVIDAFAAHLGDAFARAFGDGERRRLLVESARLALSVLARSNAMYHDVEHAITVGLVGQEMLRGRQMRGDDTGPDDWLNFMLALLFADAGFARQCCPGDAGGRCVVDELGNTASVPPGATDAWLWPYRTARSKVFVRRRFAGHAVIDAGLLAACIEYARFPPDETTHPDTGGWPGLLRAAQIIGVVADPNFMIRMKPLYLEMQECGFAAAFGFATVAEARAGYPDVFWSRLHRFIREGVALLEWTADGRQFLANMYAHLLAEEHGQPAKGVVRGEG